MKRMAFGHFAEYGESSLLAMMPAPHQEGEGSAVPETAEQEYDEIIDIGAHLPLAVAAQREVYVFAEETRESDVPALPELVYRKRTVG